jgi:hypothetical protein
MDGQPQVEAALIFRELAGFGIKTPSFNVDFTLLNKQSQQVCISYRVTLSH